MTEDSTSSMEKGSMAMITSEKEAGGSSSWIVEMEKLLDDANPAVEMENWKKTSIYRVPEWIKDETNRKAYEPWLVSLGPFHHGEPNLLPMEEHKRRAVLHLVKRSGRPLGEFVTAMEEVVDKLQEAYQGLDDRWCGDGKGLFVEMMVTDGCFLLEVMRADAPRMEGQADVDYAANDPVFSKYGLNYLFGIIRADLVVIENQLPLLAIEKLIAVRDGMPQTAPEINNNVREFLDAPCFAFKTEGLGLHPLDIFHRSICGGRPQHEESREADVSIPAAAELREAGVLFKKSNTPWVHDVGFENGVLSIPALLVDSSTEKEMLNLSVFEQLHRTVGNDVTNYLIFMDSLIDSETDAGLLISTGILESCLSSDTKVADLFNNLTHGATWIQTKMLQDVVDKAKVYCTKRRNRWRAFFMRTYLSNPWVFISLVAATILLLATVMQTIYTVVPFYATK